MEHWEELRPGGYRLVWDDALFRPGTDSFLLSSLPRLTPGLRVCDLGSGTGLLGVLLLQRQRELTVTGIELDGAAAALARRCAAENGLADRLRTLQGDLRQVRSLLSPGSFDLVISNPPYFDPARGRTSRSLPAARSELTCTLEDVAAAGAYLLRWGGRLCLVHKPERLTDLLTALRTHGVEPKRLRPVVRRAGDAPSLLLAEGRRGGRPGLSIEAPLILEGADGAPTAELDAIYFRTQEELP